MVYKFLRILATIACKIYFKKLHIQGLEHVPEKGPLLIACNHPNGFAEPILLSCILPRVLHFLVRGDVFKIKPLKPLLIYTNQIPIFRSKDGFKNLRNNNKSFEAVIDNLAQDAAILIFVEGTTQLTKRLRPLQKGMSKLAFMALEEHPDLDIQVLPVGVNFTHPKKFRSEVIINVGSAFAISEYQETYNENPQKAHREITKRTYDKMDPLVVSIAEEDLVSYEQMAEMTRALLPHKFYPFIEDAEERMDIEKQISSRVKLMDDDEKKILQKEYEAFRSKLKPRLSYYSLLTFLPAIIGYALWFIPIRLTQWIADKYVTSLVFYSSVRISGSIILSFFYHLIVSLILCVINWKYMIVYWALLPLGYAYIYLRHKNEHAHLEDYALEHSRKAEVDLA